MKLILPLSSLIHCHNIKSAHMTAYLMSMKPPLRLALDLCVRVLHMLTLILSPATKSICICKSPLRTKEREEKLLQNNGV
jgi:hypothetical protein